MLIIVSSTEALAKTRTHLRAGGGGGGWQLALRRGARGRVCPLVRQLAE